MDPTILQLFGATEILERLAHKHLTGCFKVFTNTESANIFFKKGIIVAAINGESQGEAALRQILHWKEALYVWQADLAAPIPPLQAVTINVELFLRQQAQTSTKPVAGSVTATTPVATKALGNGAAASQMATKSITATAAIRSAEDEALLKKHRLALVSLSSPAKKYPISKVNNLIGRNPGCDILIADPSISRQHCLLQIEEQGLLVKDLNTVNGTKINGITTKEGYVNAGDKLTVGHLGFVVEQVKD
jgi:hypothetical protein